MSNLDKITGEKADAAALAAVSISKDVRLTEQAEAEGVYTATCVGPREEDRPLYIQLRDRIQAIVDGAKQVFVNELETLRAQFAAIPLEQKWADEFPNVVTTVGKNYLLDLLTASGFTAVGPFMGLIDANASTAVAGDTMASHATWNEVGNANAPAYTAPRKTPSFNAASAGSKSTTATSFSFTSGGTVGGCFIVTGTGALSTIDNTAGVLYSAGAFTGGSKTVANGDTLNVTYTASL